MSEKKALWFVTELFYPDETSTAYIMTCIAERLAADREIQVICGPSSYQDSALQSSRKISEKIQIHRMKTVNLDKNHLISRLIKFAILSIQLSAKLLVKASKGDDVFIVTNPAPLVLLISSISRLRNLNLTILVHDVFPENLVAVDFIKSDSFKFNLLKSLFNNAYSKANRLIVLGRDMRKIMKEKLFYKSQSPEISIIENWADIENITPGNKVTNELCLSLGLQQKIIFQFAGNLGRLQGLIELLEVIKEIKNSTIHFLIIGEGALKDDINAFIEINSLKNITLLSSLPRDQQNTFLNAADVGIVSLASKMFGLGVPSKTYNIMAAGKPLLYIGPENSEIYTMIKENDIGWCFKMDDKLKLHDFFESFNQLEYNRLPDLGLKARRLSLTNYNKDSILNKFSEILK